MAKRKHIQDELMDISQWFAGISAATPYEVPAGYFDQLPFQIMNRINNKGEVSSLPVLDEAQKNPFEVPGGYFESLPGTILNRIRALESHSPKEELENLSPVLSKLGKELPYSTPRGYFEELSRDVVDGVKAIEFVQQELELISPVLNALKKKQVYTVPKHYFENLPDDILKKVKKNSRPAGSSLSLVKTVYRYAIAATLTGVIAIGAWLFLKNDTPVVAPDNGLAGIEKISDEEIIHYLDKNELFIPENFSMASSEIKLEDVKELLSDVSDEELQQYLEKHSVSRDIINN